MVGDEGTPGGAVPEPDRLPRMLTLLRPGQSAWNAENRFTGWTDVDLSDVGVAEAHRAARPLQEYGLTFDVAFSSVLKRAIRTLWIIQDDLDRMWIPVHLSWRLNERHYGALQSLDKAETASRFGWKDSIEPRLDAGERVLIVAHGNSLRGLVKHLDGLGDEEIAALEIPTGVPLVYRMDAHSRPIGREYLGGPVMVHGSSVTTSVSAVPS